MCIRNIMQEQRYLTKHIVEWDLVIPHLMLMQEDWWRGRSAFYASADKLGSSEV